MNDAEATGADVARGREPAALAVRTLTPGDVPQLLAFLARHFPLQPGKFDERRFRWLFAEHPLGTSLDEYCLALRGEEIIGQLATLRDRLLIDGAWRDARWLVDLIVTPEQRGGLAALRMFQELMAREELLLTVGAGPQMAPLLESLGWRRMRVAESYFLPIRPAALLRMADARSRRSDESGTAAPLPAPLPTRLAAGAEGPVLPSLLRRFGTCSRGDSEVRIESLTAFTPDHEAFLARTLPQLGIATWRTRDVWEWKFVRRPAAQWLGWEARDARSSEVRGVLVARRAERDGAKWLEVVDYVVPPSDERAFDALLRAVVDAALDERSDFIRMRLSRGEHLARLPRPWWRKHTLPVTDEVFAWHPDAALLARLERGPWHFTSLASDRAEDGRGR